MTTHPSKPVLAPVLTLCVLWTASVAAQVPGAEERRSEKADLNYLITQPTDPQASKPWPMILFLHGGDRSNTRHHPRKYAPQASGPFFIVAPQLPTGRRWSDIDFDGLLSEITKAHPIDAKRIYLTGYSMGGYGSWDLLARSPHWFAAASPIAGGGDPSRICVARKVSVKAFHGDRDNVIPLSSSQRMVKALKACGGSAELVVYPGVDHGSWPRTFRDPSFYQWLLSHQRTP